MEKVPNPASRAWAAEGASDSEDGTLTGLEWSTNRTDLQPAFLMSGTSGTVRLYGIACTGVEHIVTVTVYDADGNRSEATRVVALGQLC